MPRRNKVLVIINPRSGRLRVRSQLFDIASCFSENGCETTVFTTRAKGDAERYAAAMADRFDIVVCRGGDGTLNEVVNGIMRAKEKKPIGFLPAGTSNDFAHTLGIPDQGKKAVLAIVNGSPVLHDIGIFNNERCVNYTASFGLFTKSSYSTPQPAKNLLGYGAYLSVAVKELSQIKTHRLKVTCDGEVFEGDYVFGSVTNALAVGGFIHYKKEEVDFNDGIFEMVLVKKPDNIRQWYDALKGAYKGNFDDRFVTLIRGREFKFESDQAISWSLDGEYGGEHRLSTFKVIQSGIEIIRKE